MHSRCRHCRAGTCNGSAQEGHFLHVIRRSKGVFRRRVGLDLHKRTIIVIARLPADGTQARESGSGPMAYALWTLSSRVSDHSTKRSVWGTRVRMLSISSLKACSSRMVLVCRIVPHTTSSEVAHLALRPQQAVVSQIGLGPSRLRSEVCQYITPLHQRQPC